MNPQSIKNLIIANLPDANVVVESDDDTHFKAWIVSEQFIDKTTVQQHQLVYKALGEKMGREIHALSMQTYTPEQWKQKQKK